MKERSKLFVREFVEYLNQTKIMKVNEVRENTGTLTIPAFNVEIEKQNLKAFWRAFYTILFGENSNTMFFIVNAQSKEILESYLIWSDSGKYPSIVEILDMNALRITYDHLSNLEMLFEAIKPLIKDKYDCNLGNIAVIDNNVFNLIEKKTGNNQNPLYVASVLMDILSDLDGALFKSFPSIRFIEFMKSMRIFLNNTTFEQLHSALSDTFPDLDILFCIMFKDINIPFGIKSEKGKIAVKSYPMETIPKGTAMQDYFNSFSPKYPNKIAFMVTAEKINEIISNISDLELPPSKERFNWILQIIIFFYRQVERDWWISPRPKFENGFVRLIFRMFGYNINPEKLVHWLIPELLTSIVYRNFGLKSNLLMILGGKKTKTECIFIKTANYQINSIEPVDLTPYGIKMDAIHKIGEEGLRKIHTECSKSRGFVSAVIFIDKKLVKTLLESYIVDLHDDGFRSLRHFTQTLSHFKSTDNFQIFPKIPLHRSITEYSTGKNAKYLLDMITEIYEF